MLATLISAGLFSAIVRIAMPYIAAALGGVVVERAGVVDLALEARLLWGAFAAASVAHATGTTTWGIAAGMGAGVVVSLLQGLAILRWRANAVVVGIGLNMLALAGTRTGLQYLYGQAANSPPCASVGDGVAGNPLFYLLLLLGGVTVLGLAHTYLGLRVRMAGERPSALDARGLSVVRTRMTALAWGGMLGGLGGAQLALAVGGFSADMSSGRGYMALGAVILSGWRPGRAILACLLIAAGEAASIYLQVAGVAMPRELAPLLPYVLTLLVLAGLGGGRRPPASLA